MRFWKALQIFFILFFATCQAEEIPTPACLAILNYIEENLPHQGILKNSDGFVYVDLDDAYVHKVIGYIAQDGFVEPPYFGKKGLVGAHITVVYPDEMKKYGVKEMKECGETIPFSPQRCQVAHPPRSDTIEEVYFIAVKAPQLDKIREKYGLPEREYDFHITIGVKPKAAKAA